MYNNENHPSYSPALFHELEELRSYKERAERVFKASGHTLAEVEATLSAPDSTDNEVRSTDAT